MNPASSRRTRVKEAVGWPGLNAPEPSLTGTELRKLILKLRWIGAEADANVLASYLAKVAPREIVNVPSGDTD